MPEQQDSLEQLPNSSGFQKPGIRFSEEQRRKQYRYVAAITKLILERHPAIEQANKATERLTQELTATRMELAKVKASAKNLGQQVAEYQKLTQQLLQKAEEYRQWEYDIHQHVASIDAKAEDIAELSEDLDTLVRLLNTIVPPLEWLAKGAMRWAKTLRALRKQRVSRVDGEDIGCLVD